MVFEWLGQLWNWLTGWLNPSDQQHIAHAVDILNKGMFSDNEAQAWLKRSGFDGCGKDLALAIRQPATRDAAIYAVIDHFYQCHDDAGQMLQRLAAEGLNNGSTTHSYIMNCGPGSIGQGSSNHQAILVVDESAEPPMVTLAFRGVHPLTDFTSPVSGMLDALGGRQAANCQQEADRFWQDAHADIARIMAEVSARHGGKMPQIHLAGHSYGADAAARMVPSFIAQFPGCGDTLDLTGYGAIQTFTKKERDAIFAMLGNDGERARQYMTRGDIIQHVGVAYTVGEERRLPIDVAHTDYQQAEGLEAMMDALRESMRQDPKHAEARARELVESYKRNPDSVLAELAAYAGTPAEGSVPSVGTHSLSRV